MPLKSRTLFQAYIVPDKAFTNDSDIKEHFS